MIAMPISIEAKQGQYPLLGMQIDISDRLAASSYVDVPYVRTLDLMSWTHW